MCNRKPDRTLTPPQIPDLTKPALLSHGNRVPGLGYIQSDENLTFLSYGSSSCAEDHLAQSGNPWITANCRTSFTGHREHAVLPSRCGNLRISGA